MNGAPRRVAGLGFRGAATVDALRAALQMALRQAGDAMPLTALATAADKAGAPALVQLAAELDLPVLAIALADLARQQAAPSAAVPARYGRQSLAESAALAASGNGARLVVPRQVALDGFATAAIAENTRP